MKEDFEPTKADSIELTVRLSKAEVAALGEALTHVRVHMAREHTWKVRDAAMEAIGKVLSAAQKASS